MIHPVRDLTLALILLVAGLAAVAWGLPALSETEFTWQGAALGAGLFVAIGGLLLTPNFYVALRLHRRLARGQGTIARWTLPPARMQAFAAAEAARPGPRPHWRPRAADLARGTDFAFGPQMVMLGPRLYPVPRSGLQSIRAVQVLPGDPPVLEFQTQTYVPVGATVQSLRPEKGLLRVPVPTAAQAEELRRYYAEVITGSRVVGRNWTSRIVIGLVVAAAAGVCALVGWQMAIAAAWRADGPRGDLPMILMIVGTVAGIFGLLLALAATVLHLRQRFAERG